MNPRVFFEEAKHEFLSGLRGPLFPLMFLGIVGYLATVLVNAQYLQEMGATDIPRNSPHLVYLMTSGQGFWLYFAWAWMYSRIITRDRDAKLQEVALASPVSLRGLLMARFVGVFALASLLGLATPIGYLVVHPMQWSGVLGPNDVGAIPWGAMAFSWFLYVVPAAFGFGSLFFAAAIRTRSAAGPFGVAGAIMLFWMLSMIIIRGGEMNPFISNVLDPLGFSEVEFQSDNWTPADKMRGALVMSSSLWINRLLWGVLPGIALVGAMARICRETLILERPSPTWRSPNRPTAAAPSRPTAVRPPRVSKRGRMDWVRAAISEARWLLELSFRGWGTVLTMVLLFFMTMAGSFVHGIAHGEGPMSPRPEFLTGLLAEFSYLILVFVIAGFVGVIMRRDERIGFDEIAGATPAPVGVRLGGRALACLGLTVAFCMIPAISGLVVSWLAAPAGVSLSTGLLYFCLCYLPALLEVCGVTIAIHAIVRSSGLAYALSMFVVFIFVLNHEVGLVNYPPAQLGVPFGPSFSELVGWGPWIAETMAFALLKLGIFLGFVAVAWLAFRREYIIDIPSRFRVAASRLWGGAGVAVGLSVAVLVAGAMLFEYKLVQQGGWSSPDESLANEAQWEQKYLGQAPVFRVQGGTLRLQVEAADAQITAKWRLEGLKVEGDKLHAELPPGLSIESATIDKSPVKVETAADHAVIALARGCAQNCTLELAIRAHHQGWTEDGEVPWIAAQQAWITARDVLPRLGIDPERALRAPRERELFGLSKTPSPSSALSSVVAHAVAPGGDWNIEFSVPGGWNLAAKPPTGGPLDFALIWRSDAPELTRVQGVEVHHGVSHQGPALSVAEDLLQMQKCIRGITGWSLEPTTAVLQAPRYSTSAIHASMLWLPENKGWDIQDEGLGRTLRRRHIAHLVASEYIAQKARLRRSPGSRWLDQGVAGYIALECIRTQDGQNPWNELLEHDAQSVTVALGALKAPIQGVAQDADADWVNVYTPLATYAWAAAMGREAALETIANIMNKVAAGAEVDRAVEEAVGADLAEVLLGRPRASDVAVAANTARVTGERWIWGEKGWDRQGSVDRVVQISEQERLLLNLPAGLEDPGAITVLDAEPSFERSPGNNVWGGEEVLQ